MQTRSKSRHIGPIEVLRRDEFTCEDISDNVEFLHTPLDPLAKPFHRNTDIVSPDLVHSITPCRDTMKERFDVPEAIEPIPSPLSLNIADTLSDDLDTYTCSMPRTASCETTRANCGKYLCGYGGGKSHQDESRDGLHTCKRCHLAICQMCLKDGRHSRHRRYIIADNVE